jgi:hypothetical protein
VDEGDDLVHHDTFGGVFELDIHGVEVAAKLTFGLLAVAGGGEVGG